MIYIFFTFLLIFSSCTFEKADSKNNAVAEQHQFRPLLKPPPFVGGGTRNGIHSMEGIEFEVNKQDTTKFDYRFSITNWRDKFKDLTGTVQLDSSSYYSDNFFIKGVSDSLVAAYKFCDNGKKYPIWIGITKRGEWIASIY